MKNKTVGFVCAKFKSPIILVCVVFAVAAFTNCNAQSIVGKWKGVSVKNFYSAEYAKQIGKSMEEKFPKDVGNSDVEYKADHTFIMNFSPLNSSEITTMKGTWSLTGDQLKLTLEPQYNPAKITTTATVTINGSTMITTALVPSGSRIIKTISTGSRM